MLPLICPNCFTDNIIDMYPEKKLHEKPYISLYCLTCGQSGNYSLFKLFVQEFCLMVYNEKKWKQ